MSQVTLQGNASGTGIFTVAAPNSNTNRTVNLPDAGGDVVLADATQTLTNKSISGAQINSGTVAVARLGSGSPSASNFLRGDGSWQSIPAPVIPTDFGAVGTYAILMVAVNTNPGVNTTIAGSSLRSGYSANASSGENNAVFSQLRQRGFNNNTYDGGGTAQSGTWRKMDNGTTFYNSGDSPYISANWKPALFVRIS
jgi:hypothetical protein